MNLRIFQAIWILPFILANSCFSETKFDIMYEWKYIDYNWQNDSQKAEAVASGYYDPSNIAITGMLELPGDQLLVLTPRTNGMNPASLSLISNQTGEGGRLLEPFPDWDWHQAGGIISASKIILDDCGILWILDTGKVGDKQLMPPYLMAIDVFSLWFLLGIEIPAEVLYSDEGEYEIVAVETEGAVCEKIWIYFTNTVVGGLLVWNGTDIWQVNNEIFDASPDYTTSRSGSLQLTKVPQRILAEKHFVFKPAKPSSPDYAVSAEDLHNSYSEDPAITIYSNNLAEREKVSQEFDSNGILISASEDSKLQCKNYRDPSSASADLTFEDEIFQSNGKTLKFSNLMKEGVIYDGVSANWIMLQSQDNMKKIEDLDATNFRLVYSEVPTLVSGTSCESTGDVSTQGYSIEDEGFSVYGQ